MTRNSVFQKSIFRQGRELSLVLRFFLPHDYLQNSTEK